MAERLTMQEVIEHCDETTELMERVFTCIHDGGEFGQIESKRYLEHKQTAEWLRQLQKYKDLEEQGRLITLPCKIGDTVWDIKWWDDTTETRVIDGKTYFRRVMKHKVTKSKFKLFDYENFGKTVFLTKEEAEAALKGAENDNL